MPAGTGFGRGKGKNLKHASAKREGRNEAERFIEVQKLAARVKRNKAPSKTKK